MNCQQVRQLLDDLLTKEYVLASHVELQGHLEQCTDCQQAYDTAQQTLATFTYSQPFQASPELKERILLYASAAWADRPTTRIDANRLSARHTSTWISVLSNNLFRIAAALLLATTAAVFVFQPELGKVAYAIEQTLEANLGLRFIHIRIEPSGRGLSEAWAEFGADGKPVRLRMVFPDTEDGAKESIWQEGKAEVWFKDKKGVSVVHEPEMLKVFPQMIQVFDPRRAMQQLYKAQAQKKVSVEIKESTTAGEPITLLVTPTGSGKQREVYHVDPQTKLVERIEKFRFADGKWKFIGRHEYLDYNQEIPLANFAFDLPDDVTRVDTTSQLVGLAKGDLSDEEVAVKVARQFFEALIDKDYATAGTILSGMPATKMEELFGKSEFVRIISVGQAVPHPDIRTHFLQVPCEVEFQVNGEKQVKTFMPNIRAVYNQPDRWAIGGGI